jgi:hypothetical protein
MTTVKTAKPVRRKTGSSYRGRPLVVEIHERHLTIWPLRLAGQCETLDWETVYEVAQSIGAKRRLGRK